MPEEEIMPEELSWSDAIQRVLGSADGAMHYRLIADQIATRELRRNLGATPFATVGSVISADIVENGEQSIYERVARGMYRLRHRPMPEEPAAAPLPPLEEEELGGLEEVEATIAIRAIGMFWRREWVDWGSTPKLLGAQQRNSQPVDFCEQKGVYLLHDGRETVYVGRATDQSLGRRLFQHTTDRLNGRWDRFSWFGIRPVSREGSLGAPSEALPFDQVVTELEAVLIETMEPVQNRRRGDGLRAIEYIQLEDPKLLLFQKLQIIEEFKQKMLQG